MPAPFKQISREQFSELLSRFPFQRKINAVHMHHTWRPNHAEYQGHDTIVAMWRFHTQTNGWSDIAQHITIAPDGSIWLGRDWNRAPASAAGHNGNAQAGPFMFEMIGDFDEGKDAFDGEQRQTALDVIALVQQRFGLPTGTLQLHNMMSTKTCPGTSIDYQTLLHDVDNVRNQLHRKRAAPAGDSPFSPEQLEVRVQAQQVVREAIEDLQRSAGRGPDPHDAEPCTHGAGHADDDMGAQATGRGAARGVRFDASDLAAMRPHVINLRMGQFSDRGDWTTAAHDVDAIFDDHLPAALRAARAQGRRLRLMFYAHGGLTDEATALLAARARIGWWQANDIYPIHFVWETGLGEVLGQMLERWQKDQHDGQRAGQREGQREAARNFFSDHVSDPLVEAFAHRAGGVQIWNSMKWSAQQSSWSEPPVGAAFYVADKLAAFCRASGDDIEIHAAGHSAGAIFHAHFIPCALARGVPRIDSLHLLAPAVRVDLFRQNLFARVGPRQGIEKLTLYTMSDSFEKEDSCGNVYRKSLLYLIYRGLEPDADVPILGLERCLRADADLKRLFGLGGGERLADVVWSDNGLARGRSASRSRTHGGFDDDPATMGSIVRRVLGKSDADRIVELPAGGGRGADPWAMPAGAPMEETPMLANAPMQPVLEPAGGGRRLALCVGIDAYPTAPLGGCVNDARDWATAFMRLGFERPRMLLDRQATRDGIMSALAGLVTDSRAGDVIVFQYAGHGTQVPDLDGDEIDGDTPDQDEALCPVDFDSGALLIDDDLRTIFARLPDGVNLTCFFDCCHSGTITRMALGGRRAMPPSGKRARFVPASRQLVEAYAATRQAGAARMASRALPPGGLESMREIVFSACLSSEVALESQGHGDFTRCALQVLAQDRTELSNAAFAEAVTAAFGPAPQQHAKLYGSDAGRALALLRPLASIQPAPASRAVPGTVTGLDERERQELAAQLARASQLLAQH
jgi:hypothetical protein